MDEPRGRRRGAIVILQIIADTTRQEREGYQMQSHGRAGLRLGLLARCLFALGAHTASAQKFQTIIGLGNEDGLAAAQTTLNGPWNIATDAAGDIYVLELGELTPGLGGNPYPQVR